MIKRLLVGLVIGLVMGSLLAALLVKGLGMLTMSAVLAYLFAAVTGVVVGLVAGKPIWAKGGQIEAGLKAGFGALLGAAAMFAIRRWLNFPLDLAALGAGAGHVGELPAAALPMIAAVLGAFYEADNTPAPEGDGKSEKKGSGGGAAARATSAKSAAASSGKKARVAAPPDDDDLDADAAAPSKRGARR
jgi:hypothetical protein